MAGPDDRPSAASTGGSPASERLVQSLQEFVQEELRRKFVALTPETSRKGRDFLWFVILVINLALLLSWFPEEWLEDSRLKLLIEMVPWLLSALVFTEWFRELLRGASGKRVWRLGQVVLLGMLLLTQLPIYSFRPRLGPPDARLAIDTKPVQHWNQRFWGRLASHKLKVNRAGDVERVLQLTKSRSLHLSWHPSEALELDLIYPVNIKVADWGATVLFERKSGVVDEDFENAKLPEEWAANRPERLGATSLQFVAKEAGTYSVPLPFGHYKVREEKGKCWFESKEEGIAGPGEHPLVEFEKLPCAE